MKPSEMVQAITSALLALISVIGAFALVAFETVNARPVALPDFVSLLIGAVIGSYLTHAATVNGARQAGTAAAQTAIHAAAEGQADAVLVPKIP